MLLLGGAFILRVMLAPWHHGSDLTYYLQIGDYWFQGHPVYNNTMPFQYTPLYLYVLGMARMISGGIGQYYTILVKLPQIIADVAIGWIIISLVFNQTKNTRAALVAGAAYLFNPLIIYNAAYYGRFDQLCTFFAIAGFAVYSTPLRSSLMFALAFSTKTYSLFFLPYFFMRDWKRLILNVFFFAGTILLLSVPFIIVYRNPGTMFFRMFNLANHSPIGLTWQTVFYRFIDLSSIFVVSRCVLLAYLALLVIFPKRDFLSHAAFSLTMFHFFSQIVFEQYMTWAIPFLMLDYFLNKKLHAAWMAAIFTAAGLLCNADFNITNLLHLPQTAFNFLLAGCLIAYGIIECRWILSNGGGILFMPAGRSNATGME